MYVWWYHDDVICVWFVGVRGRYGKYWMCLLFSIFPSFITLVYTRQKVLWLLRKKLYGQTRCIHFWENIKLALKWNENTCKRCNRLRATRWMQVEHVKIDWNFSSYLNCSICERVNFMAAMCEHAHPRSFLTIVDRTH